MEVGDDDGQAGEVVGVGEHGVVLAVLLVDAEDHRLARGVARLDEVARPPATSSTGGERVGGGDDDGETAGAEPALERRRVEQHGGARAEVADDVDVAERTDHVPEASRTAYSTAPAQRERTSTTTPRRHWIMG